MTARWRVYVGCSTGASGIGIHAFDLVVTERGPTLVRRSHVEGLDHPSFLVDHPTEPVLYAVSETVGGEVVAFHIDPEDGTLTEWQRVPSTGDGPCHLGTDGDRLCVANYISGSAAAYALAPDGRISDLVWSARHRGSGPHVRQEAPHAHCALPDPYRPSVHVVDLGIDRVIRYDADPTGGGFRAAAELALPPASGPRHLTFHPHDPTAYIVCELDSTLVAVDVDRATGELRPRHTASTLPDGYEGDTLAAAVRVHPGGRWVYVSNRGHDSIAVFAIGRDHPLTPLGHVSSGGRGPRDVAIDPSGRWLLAANQHSGHVAGFAIDDRTGLPKAVGILAQVREPTCVLITEVDR